VNISPAQKAIIAGWGFFMAGAICFMQAGVKVAQVVRETENDEAIQQEPLESPGIDRGIDRDGRIGVRDIRADGSEYRDDSRDGRARHERGKGEEESSDFGGDSSGGSVDAEPGS